MQHLGKWAAGIIGGVLAIAVLFYAANATSAGTYNSALFVFVVLLVFVFAQIKRGFDQAYKARHYGDDSGADEAGGSGAKAGRASAGTAQASGASAKQASGQSTAKSGAGKPSGGRSASGTAKGAAAGGAAKHGLSESAPSGPTNGTGAKH